MKIASNTIAAVKEHFHSVLGHMYDASEIDQFVVICAGEYLGVPSTVLSSASALKMSESELLKFSKAVNELKTGKPLQYVLGKADFYGLKMKVNSYVLIPRPETEELVDWIVKDQKEKDVRCLDVGTGSGCIAIALKKNLPRARVMALDVSEDALTVAQQNAMLNKVDITFINEDILDALGDLVPPGSLDVVVSNPPYVTSAEKDAISPNVLEHEPSIALFVEGNPLLFYGHIAGFAAKALKKGGCLYFEMGQTQPATLPSLLEKHGFSDIEVRKDLSGKERMIKACLK